MPGVSLSRTITSTLRTWTWSNFGLSSEIVECWIDDDAVALGARVVDGVDVHPLVGRPTCRPVPPVKVSTSARLFSSTSEPLTHL